MLRPRDGEPGAASTAPAAKLDLGRFPIPRLAVGSLVQEDLLGPYAAFPRGLEQIHGLVSHGFLRLYRWTIDFMRMTMRFAQPG